MSNLWISAGIKVADGKNVEEAVNALNTLARVTREELGNQQFQVLQQQDNPALVTLWECWTNEAALQQHFEAEHTKQFLKEGWTEVVYIEKLQLIA